jgi:hypothetical protein
MYSNIIEIVTSNLLFRFESTQILLEHIWVSRICRIKAHPTFGKATKSTLRNSLEENSGAEKCRPLRTRSLGFFRVCGTVLSVKRCLDFFFVGTRLL